MIATINPRDQ